MIGARTTRERTPLERRANLLCSALVAMPLVMGCGAPSSGPSSGGATYDFGGGSRRGCSEEREVELDEHIDALGYSPRQVLEAFGDTQTFRIVWVANCSSDSCEVRENDDDERDRCEIDESQLPSFAGTQSEITVTVRPTGALADAIVPGPEESADTCAGGVGVPVEVTLESDDGSVGGMVESGVGIFGPEDVEYVGIPLNHYATELGGKLAAELPPGSVVEATMEAVPGGSYAHLWVMIPGQGPGGFQLLLEGLMLPNKECRTPFQGPTQG